MAQRNDIQALRGLAILLVVFYHAKLFPLPDGYLGVDIFFVISGYLITSLIARGIQAGTFTFKGFYYRRARRLLPAAYVTLAICIALSPYMLTSIEMHDFAMQVLGTVTFTGNFVLWSQTGYFEGAAELKPLLHVWSLAIEEQYYMLLPAVLVFVRQRFWLPLVLVSTIISLALLVWLGPVKPGATFYLFPTRAWELGIGTVLALVAANRDIRHGALRYLGVPALAILLLIPAFPLSLNGHPEIDAVLVCLATAIIIAGGYRYLNGGFVVNALAWVGNISYSLYLVHWPVFAFINNAYVGVDGLSWPIKIGALLFSFLLAYLIYAQVEHRFRLTTPQPVSMKSVLIMFVISMSIVGVAFLVERGSRSAHDYEYRLRGNIGFSSECGELGDYTPKRECRNVEQPKMVVWGDSFAMHLVPGLAATNGKGVMQATRSVCAPYLGFSLLAPPKYGQKWAESCIKFNQDVFDAIVSMPSVEVVVLASEDDYFLYGQVLTKHDNHFAIADASIPLAVSYLRSTVEALRKHGKRVVVVGPPPRGGFDIARCIERADEGKIQYGAPKDCRIVVSDYEKGYAGTLEFHKQIEKDGFVNVFSFRNALCNDEKCETRVSDSILYRDTGHLSYEGSIALAEKLSMTDELWKLAR